MSLRYACMFSGIGAAPVAFTPLGWTPVMFAEIAEFPSAVLAYRFPAVPGAGDITTFSWGDLRGHVDVLMGSPPCQAFSLAGLRGSLGDSRGQLTLHYARAIHDLDPWACLTENVPGWLSTRDNAFGCFLAALVGSDAPLFLPGGPKWPRVGVVHGPARVAAWRVLDAQHFGVPQQRRRVFVLAFRAGDGIDPAEVLLESAFLLGDPASCGAGGGPGADEPGLPRHARNGRRAREWPARVSGTMDAQYGHKWGLENQHAFLDGSRFVPGGPAGLRRLTPVETERLFGFPDDYTAVPFRGKPPSLALDAYRYTALGNSIAVPVLYWIAQRIDAARPA